jgi:hypothetical protein
MFEKIECDAAYPLLRKESRPALLFLMRITCVAKHMLAGSRLDYVDFKFISFTTSQ